MKHASHGEINFYKTDLVISQNLKKINAINKMYIVAESEVTGNHHYVEEKEDVTLYIDNNGIIWIENKVTANVRCVIESRHSTVELEPGIWIVEPSLEYDYITEEVRLCKD